MKIDALLDHGPIVSQFKEDIDENDTTEILRNRLFERSAVVLTTLIPAYIQGKITPREQKNDEATYTRQIKKEDGFIPSKYLSATLMGTVQNPSLQGTTLKGKWEIPFIYTKAKSRKLKAESKYIQIPFNIQPSALSLNNYIRAMDPWPGAWTDVQLNLKPNTKDIKRLKILKSHIEQDLSLKSSVLCLDLVQLEGKSPVSWKQFVEGYPEARFN